MKRITSERKFRAYLKRHNKKCRRWKPEVFAHLWKKYENLEILFIWQNGQLICIMHRAIVDMRSRRKILRVVEDGLPYEDSLLTALRAVRNAFLLRREPRLAPVYARRERLRELPEFPGLLVQFHTSKFETKRIWTKLPEQLAA